MDNRPYPVTALLLLLLLTGCLSNVKNQPGEPAEKESSSPGSAWVDRGEGREDASAIVGKIDGMSVMLKDKPQPIDVEVRPETLFFAYKPDDLPGYNIFTITPGMQSPDSPKTIEIDQIGLRKEGNKSFLELVYRTNKEFDFGVGLAYTKDPELNEMHRINSPAVDASPIVSAQRTEDWQTASIEINPRMLDELTKTDIAVNYLESLDQQWRTGDKRFVWDGGRISADYASHAGESMKSRFGAPTIRLLAYGGRMLEMSYSAPALSQKIIVIENGTQREGGITIAFG